MRGYAINLLIRLIPLILLTANDAHGKSAVRGALEHASAMIVMMSHSIRGSDPAKAPDIRGRAKFIEIGGRSSGVRAPEEDDAYRRSLAAPLMIIWADCDAFANGNAFSTDSINGPVDALGQGISTSDDEASDRCGREKEDA